MLNFGLLPDRKALNELSPVLTKYRKSLIKILMDITPEDYSKAREIRAMKKFDKTLESFYSDAKRWMEKHIKDTFYRARNIGIRVMEQYGQKKDPTYSKTNTEAALQKRMNEMDGYFRKAIFSAQDMSRQYFHILRQATRKFIDIKEFGGLSDEDTAVLLSQVETMVEEEASRGRIAKRVQEFLKKRVGDGNFVEVNGRYYDIKKHSMTIARTELRRAQSDGIENVCDEYANDLVEISDHGTDTEVCLDYEGKVFSLSGQSYDMPELDYNIEYLDEEPPFHPNCQHSMLPTSEEAISTRKKYETESVKSEYEQWEKEQQ